MASEAEHLEEDVALFGNAYPEVHRLLDQFAHYPDMSFLRHHRKFLHHQEGIEYIGRRWGLAAARSASQHVTTDCGHVPKMADYHNGSVDSYGVAVRKSSTRPPFDPPDSRTREDREEARREHLEAHG